MDEGTSEKSSGGSEAKMNSPTWRDPTAHCDTPYIVSGQIHGWDPAELIGETSRAFQTEVANARKQAAKMAARLQQKLQDQRTPRSFGWNKHAMTHAARVGTCVTLHLLALLVGWWLFGPWPALLAIALPLPLTYTWLKKPKVHSPRQEEDRLDPVPTTSLSSMAKHVDAPAGTCEDSPKPESRVEVEPTLSWAPRATDGPVAISSQGITCAGDLATVSQTLTGECFKGPQVMITDEDGISMFFIGTHGGYKVIPVPGPGLLIKFARDGGMPTNENITGYFYSLPSEADINAAKLIRDVLQPKHEVRFFGGYINADPAGVNWKRYTVDDKEVLVKTKRADEGITGEFHVGNDCIVAFRVEADGTLGNVHQIEHSKLKA